MKLPATVLSHLRSSVAVGASLGALWGAGCDLSAVAPASGEGAIAAAPAAAPAPASAPDPEAADKAPTATGDDAAPTGLAGTVARTVERNRATRIDPAPTTPTFAPTAFAPDEEDPTAFVPFTTDPEPVTPTTETKTKRRPPVATPVATPSKGDDPWVCGPCGRG